MNSPLLLLAICLASLGATRAWAAAFDYHAGKAPDDLAQQPAFTADWSAPPNSAADVSFLLEAPAGRNGHIEIRDGHLAYPDGRRFRIWGINATGGGALPTKDHAPRLAAHFARLGINCVRFHFLDRPAPRGVLAANRDDTRALDPEMMDRLDWFVAELKRRGIYSNLNLNVARGYKPGDGVKDHELLGFAKALTFFDPRLLELQREYARQLLSHRNPYTGATYAQEPAIAIVELVNENSLVEAWKDGRLRGKNTRKNPSTWTDIPASYAADLTTRFNAWAAEKYPIETRQRWSAQAGQPAGAPLPRLAPDEFAKAPADRFHAEAEFYLELERTFYLSMAKFLRTEVGVRALLVGNSDHGHARTGYPQLLGTSLLDVVDGHVYWQHPKDQTDPQSGRKVGFTIKNTPMVDEPLFSTVVELSRSAFAGKPYTVSEVNHPFPHEFACEGIPILAAYAALHDWDGLFWYTAAHQDIGTMEAKIAGHFDLAMDPVKLAQLPAGALLFLRGDVRPARRTDTRSYTREQVREGIRLSYQERPYFTPGFPRDLPLRHATRISSFDGPATASFAPGETAPWHSDTGELQWQAGAPATGVVSVDTERTQALIGFVREHRGQLRHLAVETTTPFCAITLSALDDHPIARAPRLLVTATARVANTAMIWNVRRDSLEKWGGAPTRIEPVRATLRLAGLAAVREVRLDPLDGAGRVVPDASVAAQRSAGAWAVPLRADTTSYLLTIRR
jgi:hypothetical protein